MASAQRYAIAAVLIFITAVSMFTQPVFGMALYIPALCALLWATGMGRTGFGRHISKFLSSPVSSLTVMGLGICLLLAGPALGIPRAHSIGTIVSCFAILWLAIASLDRIMNDAACDDSDRAEMSSILFTCFCFGSITGGIPFLLLMQYAHLGFPFGFAKLILAYAGILNGIAFVVAGTVWHRSRMIGQSGWTAVFRTAAIWTAAYTASMVVELVIPVLLIALTFTGDSMAGAGWLTAFGAILVPLSLPCGFILGAIAYFLLNLKFRTVIGSVFILSFIAMLFFWMPAV